MSRLLLVDDEDALRRWERRVLEAQRFECQEAADVPQARAALEADSFELALLDVNLPGESGIDLLSEIRADHSDTAVVMVTGEDDLRLATRAIELGAYGYMVKPVRAGELLINVTNALYRRRREVELTRRLEDLKTSRQDAEQDLRQALRSNGHPLDPIALLESEAVRTLVRLAEFRDAQTGQHLVRMSRYAELIGLSLGLDASFCAELRLASELHDVGKVAIPDRILLKPGTLTSAERRVMETHTDIGHSILSGSGSELLRLAASIALTHHERWDGNGYPRGLAGTQIPLEGRIAAVADVFDALTSDRVYRPAFPVGMALEMMEAERGRHFEERMLQALHDGFEQVEAIRSEFGD